MRCPMRTECQTRERGFVLITTLLMLSVFLALFAAYFVTTSIDTSTVKYSKDTVSGFYAAEGGLNLRAETIRNIFVDFNRPSGTAPSTSTTPCSGSNMGTGDYMCSTKTINNRTVKTYVTEDPSNPVLLTIPPGERYQNLTAQEYRYTALSHSTDQLGDTEAQLELRFRTRLVPLFQFAAFYNKDLEILPGPAMSLAGPVHTNGDLYLYSNSATLDVLGQITAGGDVWRGRKDGSVSPSCNNNQVRVKDPNTLRVLVASCPSRYKTTATDRSPFNNMIQTQVQKLVVPEPEVFDPTAGAVYWDHADLRLVLKMTAADAPNGIEVRNANDTNFSSATTTLSGCAGSIATKATGVTTIKNFRENKNIRLLDVDLQALFNCLKNSNWFGTGKLLSDATDGGLVIHLSVKGPNSNAAANSYGVRVKNAQELKSTAAGAPAIKGLTFVSDQAMYIQGNFNSVNKKPLAVMADSLNVLSAGWNDANAASALSSRIASSTTINGAFLAGTDVTGGVEGASGQGGAYNGGLENYPRFHEDWSGKIMTYRGSFVSLNKPRHVNGTWSAQSYSPPSRDWNYDTSFNDAANLPPITPRFVYLRQELFVRDFEQE